MNPARDGVAAVVADADAALRAGNALQCFELVERAIARGIRDPDLDYRAVLALAHCGNAQQALDRYHRTAHPQPDQDWLALEGRLFKDLAQQDSAAAGFMYARAAQAYWQAFQKTGGYFSAVNAATTFLLAGDTSRAEAIARDVLAMTQSADSRDPLEQYNVLVTHAEAALLLGEHERCRESLRRADTLVPDHRTAQVRRDEPWHHRVSAAAVGAGAGAVRAASPGRAWRARRPAPRPVAARAAGRRCPWGSVAGGRSGAADGPFVRGRCDGPRRR